LTPLGVHYSISPLDLTANVRAHCTTKQRCIGRGRPLWPRLFVRGKLSSQALTLVIWEDAIWNGLTWMTGFAEIPVQSGHAAAQAPQNQ
jgi:hypothetical protein